jgi:hypothetical protein
MRPLLFPRQSPRLDPAGWPMPDLLRLLAAGCPKLNSHSITDRCDVHCPDLSGLFAMRSPWRLTRRVPSPPDCCQARSEASRAG